MANIDNIQDFINSVTKQAYGETAVTATDLTGLISLGNTVLSSTENVDKYTGALVDRIGKTIISNRKYNSPENGILMDTFSFGAIMQKIYVAPLKAVKNPKYDLTDGTAIDQYVITKPTVKQKLFDGRDLWEIDVTIPDDQLATAFTSWEQMAAFIDAIYMAVDNSLEMQLESTANMAYANFIGEKLIAQTKPSAKGVHCVHLLQAYNTAAGKTITAAEALRDTEFLKFASKTIRLYIKRMAKPSVLFNAESYVRHTPSDLLRVTMLSDFVECFDTYLQSDTFHNDFVALPNHREIPYWQGTGDGYGFNEISTIDITTASGTAVKQTGVVCLLNDVEAIGMMINNPRVTSSPHNAKGEYTNYFYKSEIRYFNDLSEQGIVFTVTDTPYSAG